MNKIRYALVPAVGSTAIIATQANAQTAGPATMDIADLVGGLFAKIGTNGLAVGTIVVALVGVAIGLSMLTRAKKGA